MPITSPNRKAKIDQDIEDEKYKLRETKADLAKELENETNRRMQAEEAYEKLKEELLKQELSNSKTH